MALRRLATAASCVLRISAEQVCATCACLRLFRRSGALACRHTALRTPRLAPPRRCWVPRLLPEVEQRRPRPASAREPAGNALPLGSGAATAMLIAIWRTRAARTTLQTWRISLRARMRRVCRPGRAAKTGATARRAATRTAATTQAAVAAMMAVWAASRCSGRRRCSSTMHRRDAGCASRARAIPAAPPGPAQHGSQRSPTPSCCTRRRRVRRACRAWRAGGGTTCLLSDSACRLYTRPSSWGRR